MYEEISADPAELPALERAIQRTAAKASTASGATAPAPPVVITGSGAPWLVPADEATLAETQEEEEITDPLNLGSGSGATTGPAEREEEEDLVNDMVIADEDDEDLAEDMMNEDLADAAETQEEPRSPGQSRGYNDSSTGDGAEKRQRLSALQQVFGLSKAHELLEKIEAEMPMARTPMNRRQRRTQMQLASKMHVAEIYSPPRMTIAAKKLGLTPGWSLDITALDPDDGLPWYCT